MEQVLSMYELPVRVSGLDADAVLNATKSDKKMRGGKIRFILLSSIGEAYISSEVSDEEMLQGLEYIGCVREKNEE